MQPPFPPPFGRNRVPRPCWGLPKVLRKLRQRALDRLFIHLAPSPLCCGGPKAREVPQGSVGCQSTRTRSFGVARPGASSTVSLAGRRPTPPRRELPRIGVARAGPAAFAGATPCGRPRAAPLPCLATAKETSATRRAVRAPLTSSERVRAATALWAAPSVGGRRPLAPPHTRAALAVARRGSRVSVTESKVAGTGAVTSGQPRREPAVPRVLRTL